jgi:biotin carboxyl carrier protein
VVLEAMKMETNITAPVAAQVASADARPGEAAQVGQVLVRFA